MGEARWDEDPHVTEESLMFMLFSVLCRIFVLILMCIQNNNRDFEIRAINADLGLGRVVSFPKFLAGLELGPLDIGFAGLGQGVWTNVPLWQTDADVL